jgi:lipopolysaccharide export system protein LptA
MNFALFRVARPLLGLLLILTSGLAYPLDSDKNAPVAIKADTTSIDFRTGQRVLTGNVVIDQGSLQIIADKITLDYKDDALDVAIAHGKPVKFKQLPEGETEYVHGEGRKLKLENRKDLITLTKQAKIEQKGNVITGKVIHYDLKTSKMTVKSDTSKSRKTSSDAGSAKKAAPVEKEKPGRTRVYIQPGSGIISK